MKFVFLIFVLNLFLYAINGEECPFQQIKHLASATYYTSPNNGNCGYGDLFGNTGPKTKYVAALSTKFYDNGKRCGECFSIYSPYTNKSLVVMGTDKCPDKGWCEADYHFDLTTEAFDILGPRVNGVLYNLTFFQVPCHLEGSVQIKMHDNSNQYWTSFLIFNSKVTIKKVSMKLANSDQYKDLTQTEYNYWDAGYMTTGPFELKIESIAGEFIYQKIQSVVSNQIINTNNQFSAEGCFEDGGYVKYYDPYGVFRIASDAPSRSNILPSTLYIVFLISILFFIILNSFK